MRSGLVAASALALAAAAACGPEADDDRRLVFQSDRDGQSAIYAVRPDGTGLERIAGIGGYYAGFVFWSPRGERLLIPRETARGGDAVVLDVRTGRRTRLPVHVLGGATWSPDGRRVAVAAERGIVVLDADGSSRRQLTFEPGDFGPSWSPDGEAIVFASAEDLVTVDLEGRLRRVLRAAGDDVFAACWLDEGRWIVFSRIDEEGLAPLEVVRPDGTGRRRVARNADVAACSPRGRTLAYVHGGDVFRVDLDGGKPRRLTFDGRSSSSFERSPAWSPDGHQIAYVRARLPSGIRDPSMPTDVWIMNADGSGKRPVTRAFPTGGAAALPGWIEVEPNATAVAPPTRLVSFPARTVLRTASPVGGVAARGSTAVLAQGLGSGTEFDNPPGPLLVWEPTRGRVRSVPVANCRTAYNPVLVAERFVYLCDNSVVDLFESEIREARVDGHTATIVRLRATHLAGVHFASRLLNGVAASREAVVYAVGERATATTGGLRAAETTIWRTAESRTRRFASVAGDATLVDADAGNVALLQGGDVVVLDAGTGAVRRRLSFRRDEVRDVELDASRIVVLRRERLSVYDVTTGRERSGVRLPRDLGSSLRLGGVRRELAVYVAGLEVHVVRLSDGRDIVLDLRTAAGPVYARLTEAGLVYTYTEPRTRPGGRAVFVPRAAVERALAAAR